MLQPGATSSNTASAIKMAATILDNESTNQTVPKIIFIVTDGNSEDPFETKYEALLAKLKGYYIYILGIGTSLFMPELESIASESDQVLQQSSFAALSSMDVSDRICTGRAGWPSIFNT